MSDSPQTTPHAASRWHEVLRRRTQLYLAAGMALLISTLVASYMQSSTGLDALKQIEQINRRADHVDRLDKLLLDAESATRGYLLTRDSIYLAPYQEATPKIYRTIEAIEKETLSDAQQHATAVQLLHYAIGVIENLDLTIEQGKANRKIEKSWLEHGKVVMDAYRDQYNTIKALQISHNLRLVEQSANSFRNAKISTVLLAMASLLLLLLAISQSHKQQELRERITELLQLENQRLEREVLYRTSELTNLATYLTKVREMEKMHLARELHDELGALLTAAKLDADWIERKLPPDTLALIMQRLTRLRQSLTSGITLKRRITNDLRPALLSDLGLLEALRALTEEFREGNEIDMLVDLPKEEPDLSEAASLSLFRIVQETFTNIQKYAQAHHVHLSLAVSETAVELSIEDDGVGFDPDSPKLARHGLAGIKHRVFTHEGQLEVQSAPGSGTTIRVVIPLPA